MEAIGLAASLVALIDAAGFTANLARTIRQRVKDAPVILSAIETDLHLIYEGLQQIQRLGRCGASGFISPHGQQAVLATLESAHAILRSIEMTCSRTRKQNSTRKLVQWPLKDHPDLQKKMGELKAMQSSLKALFQIIGLQEHSTMLLEINSMKSIVIGLSDKLEHCRITQAVPTLLSPSRPAASKHPQHISYDVASFPSWLRRVGWHLSVLKLSDLWSNGALEHYTLAFQFPIIPGFYSLGGQLAIEKAPYCQSLSLVAPSAISFGRIVAQDSEAMAACARGDLFTLKELLKSGKATLSDTTLRRVSLMSFAMQGGNKEVVEFLLDNRINVNTTFGEKQTSPLQWALKHKRLDIAEMLVKRGAHINHISMLGWSPIFYLWLYTRIDQDVMVDQIDLLDRADDLELNLIDTWGWTVLHRLAAYGTDLEVRKVVNLGADLMVKQLPLGWSAIFHSVFYGNIQTLIELMRHYPQSVIFETDEPGWTLLHVAASAGHRDITRHLLEAGSNPYAESKLFFSHIPESIWGQRCTPAKVAAAQSWERLAQYEELLEDLGIECTGVILSDDEEEYEEFWDASEFMS